MKSLKTIIHTQTKNGKTYKYAQTGYKFTRIDDKSLSASEKLQIEMMSAFWRIILSAWILRYITFLRLGNRLLKTCRSL